GETGIHFSGSCSSTKMLAADLQGEGRPRGPAWERGGRNRTRTYIMISWVQRFRILALIGDQLLRLPAGRATEQLPRAACFICNRRLLALSPNVCSGAREPSHLRHLGRAVTPARLRQGVIVAC